MRLLQSHFAPRKYVLLRSKSRPSRGFAVVIVLGLLALTLGLSYALLRTHTTDHELQRNQSRKTDARTAAQAGISVALRKLYDGSWAGAETSFTGDLTTDKLQGFVVTYTTGDSGLSTSSAQWSEYPFRLTIESKGYSIDPNTSASRSEYTIRTVVQMVRRKLNTNTVTVSGLEDYSVFQTGTDRPKIQHPVRLTGKVWIEGELEFSRDYPQSYGSNEYKSFFSDLSTMFQNQGGDYRTFSGTIYTPSSHQPASGDLRLIVNARMNIPWTSVTALGTLPVSLPSSLSSYRLYAKGKSYSPRLLPLQSFSGSGSDATHAVAPGTYEANMTTNPLGLFTVSDSQVAISSNTTVRGMIYGVQSSTNMIVSGNNITLSGPRLASVVGDATSYQLPSVAVQDNIQIEDGASRSLEGWFVCKKFRLKEGDSATTLDLTGGVFCTRLELEGRSAWKRNSSDWQTAYAAYFLDVLKSGENAYFPGWLNNNRSSWGIYTTPRLIFNPTPAGVKNHVPDWSQPIYTAHPDDGGLMWDIVRWQEIGS